MAGRNVDSIFFLNPAHRDFAAGAAPFPVGNLGDRAATVSFVAKIFLFLGLVCSAVTFGIYFYQEHARSSLVASVRTVTGEVTGCEGPGRFQHIRFHYTVNGVAYDQAAYGQRSTVTGPGDLIAACAAGVVKLNYLAGDPNRWAVAPLNSITRDELNQGISAGYLAGGPAGLFVAAVFSLCAWHLRGTHTERERLAREGTILDAELVKAKMSKNDESAYNIDCDYRFTDPRGAIQTGSAGGIRSDINKANLPPAETPLLVLYVDEDLHLAL